MPEPRRRRRATSIISGLALAALAGGCSTTYQVSKLPPDGTLGTGVEGVPITLTRPEFTITQVAGSDPPNYTATVSYVPDHYQRYAMKLSPAFLAKVQFDAVFGDNGALSSTSADSQEQIGPAITAAFQFATTIAGLAGGVPVGGGGGGGGGAANFTTKLRIAGLDDIQDPDPHCLDATNVTRIELCALAHAAAPEAKKDKALKGLPCTRSAAVELKRREQFHVDAKGADKGTPLSGLYANTQDEADCVRAASTFVQDEMGRLAKATTNTWQTTFANSADPAFAKAANDTVAGILDGKDIKAARGLLFAVARAQKSPAGDPSFLAQALGDPKLTPTAADVALIDKALKQTRFKAATATHHDDDPPPAEPVSQLVSGQAVVDGIAAALSLEPPAWRGRRLTAIQNDLECAQRRALGDQTASDCLSAPPPSSTAALADRIEELRKLQAALVNMGADYARLAKLDDYLGKDIPTVRGDMHVAPSAEYSSFAAQAAAIRTAIATQATAAQAQAQPKPKADADLPPVSPWVDKTCIDASKEANWIYGEGAAAPDFVVVIRRADDPKKLELPPYMSKCGQ